MNIFSQPYTKKHKLENIEEGDKVWSYRYGPGIVEYHDNSPHVPIFVRFIINPIKEGYDYDGNPSSDENAINPDLFISPENFIIRMAKTKWEDIT